MFFTPMNVFLGGLAVSVLMLLALIPASMAEGKGLSFFRWYIYGLTLFPFAMFHAIIIYEKPLEEINRLKTTVIEYLHQSPRYQEIFGRRSYWDEVMIRSNGEINGNCPVDAVSMTVRFSLDRHGYEGRLDFINLSDKMITGIKCRIHFKSLTLPGLQDNNSNAAPADCLVQNRPAVPGEIFSSDYTLPLNGVHLSGKSEIHVVVDNVLFSDDSVWTNHSDRGLFVFYYDAEKSREVHDLRLIAGDDAVSYAASIENHWICVCGTINRTESVVCKHCHRSQENTLAQFSDRNELRDRLRVYMHIGAELIKTGVPKLSEEAPEPDQEALVSRHKDFIIIMILVILVIDMLLGIRAGFSLSLVNQLGEKFAQLFGMF